ncbi:MAG: diguanylate cyclase [Gammaproteobacteria bacterium]|nr:diguanylate cyclase [Gammaproteobacteria bacterium]
MSQQNTTTSWGSRGQDSTVGLDRRVSSEVVSILYRHARVIYFTNLFIAVVTVLIFHVVVSPVLLWSWLLAMVSVNIVRLHLHKQYRQQPGSLSADEWLNRFTFGSLSSGLILAVSSSFLFFTDDILRHFFLLLVMVGMLGGATASLAAYLPAFNAYFFSLSIPFVIVLLSGAISEVFEGIWPFGLLMMLVYVLALYIFARITNEKIKAALYLQHENQQLRQQLDERSREKEQVQKALRLSDKIINNVKEGVIITDANTRIIRVNATFSDITGYSESEVIGKLPSVISSGKQDKSFYEYMWRSLSSFGEWEGEIWNKRKNGEIYPEWLSISVMHDSEGNVSNYVGWFRDITQHKREEERLSYLANYDTLTGLPNRKLFMERLDLALADCIERDELVAILFIDLNLFKEVNDNFGHDAGDVLLREVALRMKEATRDEDTVARLGGDEFIVLTRQMKAYANAEHIAQKLCRAMDERPFYINGNKCEIGLSIGISYAPQHSLNRSELLKFADSAMYQAKQDRSGSQWVVYK